MPFINKWKNKTNTPTYNSWRSMRNRILFDSSDSHKFYKEKKISICDRWIDNYDNFYNDMGERPFGTSLDRINPDGNYEPLNCRWASHRVQQNNKHGLTVIEKDGVYKTIGEWAFELELTEKELSKAYKRYSTYKARTFEEIFCVNLYSLRKSKEEHCCIVCSKTKSSKWRIGMCANCYARALRWSKKNNGNIAGYAQLVADTLNDD